MTYRINVAASILARNEHERRSDPAIVVTACIDGIESSSVCVSVDVQGPSRLVQADGSRVYLETAGPIWMVNPQPYHVE